MLSKQRCPYTGIVNYFTQTDPFVSVGSVVKTDSSAQYQWRWYDAARTISGIAADMQTAEQLIKCQYRKTKISGEPVSVLEKASRGRSI